MTTDELAARGVKVRALIEAYWKLRSYAVHDDDCTRNKPPRFRNCSCGLTAAIKAGERAADLAEVAEDDPAALAASPEVQALIREAEARGMERAAAICNERGVREQADFGLRRSTQNYYRARDAIRAEAAAIRAPKEPSHD